ncbi:hypothetical protein VFPFJ_09700 [Purpureocillium lilacinum]|uniref:Uncharacterized protein n=1 Tax=Purpureocillium lilacinum TaxID=33203 RepID=A0A179GTF9_PURLI|nr:hypothetical protein VFPFJ_09700 [Purpureocillium lilacinum]OAQ75618.1 hypothetical protein VFPBJ_09591 [Purpureocillium lilacinum]OAQ81245.1 hypothetical protein VFPFJ_09700 [Purpureocillium lilacinum]
MLPADDATIRENLSARLLASNSHRASIEARQPLQRHTAEIIDAKQGQLHLSKSLTHGRGRTDVCLC